MFSSEVLLKVSKEVGAPVSRVETTLRLLEEGATVPFIARYRKEVTGNLDEVKIRDIDEKRHYYKDLEDRRNTVLSSIEKQGKLTDELKEKILACFNKTELEDIYLPFKPKRKTKAGLALDRGLEPLAQYMWAQSGSDPAGVFAEQFVNAEKEIPTVEAEKFIASLIPQVVRDLQSQFAPLLESAVRDAYDRLLQPSIQNEVRSFLRERAESEAIKVFEENLRTLLLAPPAGQIGVIGIDPGQRTGCKVAVVDETGKFLENQTIYMTEPKKDLEAAEKILLDLVQKHNVRGIAIGNGTASRETEGFVRSVVEKNQIDIFIVVVNESGASIYSASKRAREEFPKLDVTVRGAISIARRLQDPLAELVKTEPKSIGVGQYQHDVDQKKLKRSLASVVESCVNRVGVDLNSASVDLLKYVSGIGDKLAQNVVGYRDQHGLFRSRTHIREIEGFGDKTFEQAAGFLRIKDAGNPLDRTAVHPESYPLVERMAASLGVSVNELVENPTKINAIDFKAFETESGRYTVSDIREELLRPGRDPREKFVVPKFREDVKEIGDLKDGMELEGTVTNVTNFGAFVDLGVHQDGLVHISELSHKYVQDARQAVKVGEIVKVKVIGVDPAMKRISLSMKALIPKPPKRVRGKKRPQTVPEPTAAMAARATGSAKPSGAPRPKKVRPERQVLQKQQTRPPRPPGEAVPPAPNQTMEEKIRLLQEKFGRAR